MRGDERVGDALDPAQRDLERRRAVLAQRLGQRPALDELHHEDVVALVRDDVEQRDDVRVADRRGGARLAQHARAALDIAGGVGRQHLERDVAIEPLVARAPDLAHRALAELRDEPVRPDEVSRLWHGAILLRLGGRGTRARTLLNVVGSCHIAKWLVSLNTSSWPFGISFAISLICASSMISSWSPRATIVGAWIALS